MRKRHLWWILFVILASSCRWSPNWSLETHEQQVSSGDGVYAFDSTTILQSLAQGKKNLFTPQSATQEPSKSDLPPVQWSQTDFYRVAQAFHELVWQESMEGWKLRDIFFRLKCEYAPSGPQFVSFAIFKTTRTRQVDSRLERNLYVEPQQNHVSWIGIEYYPERSRWSSVDLAQVKIPAEQALQIAESQGGREARLAANNKCDIYGSLVADLSNNDWQLRYSGEQAILLFEINIDEQTGEYKIAPRKTK